MAPSPTTRTAAILELRQQIRQLEHGHPQHATPQSDVDRWQDHLLPAQGLTEWLAEDRGCGAATLALSLLRRVLPEQGVLVVIDGHGTFHPPAGAALGIDLGQIVLVRPHSEGETLWALEQTLRCRSVAATMTWLDRVPEHASRRLQLAVEAGGGRGVLIRPAASREKPSWAAVRLLVRPVASVRTNDEPPGWRLHLEVFHRRGSLGGESCHLEIGDGAADVRLVSKLAPATSLSPAAGGDAEAAGPVRRGRGAFLRDALRAPRGRTGNRRRNAAG